MDNHLRRQIRERVGTTLTGLSTTGSNVFQRRMYPMESAGLPGLYIYTQNEEVSIDAMGATRTVGRDLKLIVKGYAIGSNILVYSTLSIFRNLNFQIYSQRLRLYTHLLQFLRG